ncbi:hypothetical protein Tsp_13286, partial [Trichinella spiralis]|uniref:hypothetical protein n=1 Tax=Trichinella spiralis TaxID=6334 RepID=UPI0001EFE5E2
MKFVLMLSRIGYNCLSSPWLFTKRCIVTACQGQKCPSVEVVTAVGVCPFAIVMVVVDNIKTIEPVWMRSASCRCITGWHECVPKVQSQNERIKMHCYSSSITFYNMVVLYQLYDITTVFESWYFAVLARKSEFDLLGPLLGSCT